MKPTTAVLLTCHNRKEKTLQCLAALQTAARNYEATSLEIFLVDDGSKDGTSEAVKLNFPYVNILQGNGELYWNRGMYTAWEAASKSKDFDFYLWLNDDTMLYHNALTEMFNCYHQVTTNSIICGSIQSKNGEYTYGLTDINGNPIYPNNVLTKGAFINGNCVLLPKEVFQLIGNLDYRFPHAIGDFDYGLRAIKKGVEIYTTSVFVGTCEKNEKLPAWCYADVPFSKRVKSLYSPLGSAYPKYFFMFEFRHFGLLQAIKHYITTHLRLVFPFLWKN